MPQPTVVEFWNALGQSRLVGPAVLSSIQREHAQRSDAQGADAAAVASWLVGRGLLTRWQAKRLLAGSRGPWFVGEYRLLDRPRTGEDRIGRGDGRGGAAGDSGPDGGVVAAS